MSLRRVDTRFLLPRLVRTAAVVGSLPGWRDGLEEAGICVTAAPLADRRVELAVASAERLRDAIALAPASVIAEGRGAGRHLHRAGYHVDRFLPLPSVEEPQLLLPLDQAAPARYAVARWTVPTAAWKFLRNEAVRGLLWAHALPEPRSVATVAATSPHQPFFIARAEALGIPRDVDWFITLGEGDALTRGVFHLFPRGESTPRWVLKFARVPGYREPFDRDARGLALARAAGEAVASHVPRLLGRLECEELHASVESSAIGVRLTSALQRPGRHELKLKRVRAVADWLLLLAEATAAPAAALDDERRRLLREVVPRWATHGAQPELVSGLPPIPAVLQHNDVGPWNVVVGRPGDFTVLDWESARAHALPLWDLLYFLSEALALVDGVDGASKPVARENHFIRLFRGELRSSKVLFSYVARAAGLAGLSPEAVGAVTTLCWLHHGLSHEARRAEAERRSAGTGLAQPPPERLARLWLLDPDLGGGWSSWRD